MILFKIEFLNVHLNERIHQIETLLSSLTNEFRTIGRMESQNVYIHTLLRRSLHSLYNL